MRGKAILVAFVAALAAGGAVGAQMTPWLQWTLLPKAQMADIVGEASGENAWKMIMETGGYDKDRTPEEFSGLFYETKFYLDKVKHVRARRAPRSCRSPAARRGTAVKGELWEVTPIRQKLASYLDMAAMLATGSTTGEATGELVWVGRGRAGRLRRQGPGRQDRRSPKAAAGRCTRLACLDKGALGVISIQGTRPLFDPLQVGWASVSGTRRQAGEVRLPDPAARGRVPEAPPAGRREDHRQREGRVRDAPDTIQDIVWHIPGTDPAAGEVIFSAHLFEGYVKQGGNDDISGSAAVVEIGRTLNTLIDEGRLPAPEAHDPVPHRPGVLGHRPLGEGEQGADGEDALQHQPRHGRRCCSAGASRSCA